MDLTEKVLLFQEGGLDWNHLWIDMEDIAHRMASRDIPDESDRADFIDGLGERLRRMALRFSYRGKEFEALLRTAVRFQTASFCRRRKLARDRAHHFSRLMGPALTRRETSPEDPLVLPPEDPASMHPESRSFANLPFPVRRILLAALRNPVQMDDRMIHELSRRFRLSFDWLFCLREEMKDLVFDKMDEARTLRENMEAMEFGEALEVPRESRSRLRRSPRSPERLQERLAAIHPVPRHQDLSECLGIPAGSISSSLWGIRNRSRGSD